MVQVISMTTGLSELASVPPLHAAAVVVTALVATLLVRFVVGFLRFLRRENVLASVPQASGGNFFLGHVIPLLQVRRVLCQREVRACCLDAAFALLLRIALVLFASAEILLASRLDDSWHYLHMHFN